MTLSTDEMRQIMLDRLLRPGKEPSIKGKEADAFRASLERDIARGAVIEIPSDFADFPEPKRTKDTG